MANEVPPADQFDGLSAKVIQYSHEFLKIVDTMKERPLTDADWAPIEELVDTENWDRQGVFLAAEAESFGWPTYRKYIEDYAAGTSWEGTLRHITEEPGRVILELEERNTREGQPTHVSNTVTIYEFNDAGKLDHLDVYVMPLP